MTEHQAGSDVPARETAATGAGYALLMRLLRSLRETSDPDRMMLATGEALATHLGANRAGFLEVSGETHFTVGPRWSDGVLPDLPGTYASVTLGSAYLAEIRRGRTIGTADLARDPLTQDSRLPLAGVRASIGAPIFRAGEWRGGLFVHHATVREWTDAEVALVRDAADLAWDAVERARAVRDAQEANAYTKLLLDSTTEAFYSIDRHGATTSCNRAFLKMLGFARHEDVVGRQLHEVIHHSRSDGSHYPVSECHLYRAASEGISAHISDEIFFRQDGSSFPVEYRAAPVYKDGRVEGAICTFVDITERRQSESALRELNETLEERVAQRTRERDSAWRYSRDLQVVVGHDGIFQAANEAWTAILGWAPHEVVGRHHLDLNHPDDRAASEGALATASAGVLPAYENRVLHKDGSYRWISWVAAPEAGLVYASGRHVTAEKEAAAILADMQDQLRQSQKMEAVGQLTGGLAHDFNNLLTGVMGSLELMQMKMQQGRLEDVGRYIAAAQGAARRAAALTHRLLAFSRRQTLAPAPTDVNRLVSGMEDLIRRTVGPHVEIEVVGAAGLWTALVDAGQLENALLNLCINARDAMQAGGRITIETANKWLDERAANERGLPPGQFLSLCVTDTGTGMSPEVAARAFDPFFTTKPLGEGTGLGLSMIYGFARQSGGQVRIYSEVGRGTTMCLYLPRYDGDDATVPSTGELVRPAGAGFGKTVLVVDDEPTVRMLVTEVLGSIGYDTIEAADSPSGLRVLETDVKLDLLLTDVGLPGGMNGRQLADAARGLRPGLKVLFITGYAENAVLNNGHLDRGMHVLTKPFSMEELGRRIQQVISEV